MKQINYKILTSVTELSETVDIQKKVWGDNPVTSPHLVAIANNGGAVVGAYEQDKLVGFCLGFPAYKNNQVYVCSHMMGIFPNYRNRGIGKNLKLNQREWALSYGYKKIVWTYDLLVLKNAYLNLMKLGATVGTYIENYYGEMNDIQNKGLPSDRFVVEWDLDSDRVQRIANGESVYDEEWTSYKKLLNITTIEGYIFPKQEFISMSDEPGYLVPVPKDILVYKNENFKLASEWQYFLRKIFHEAFQRKYKLVGILVDERNDLVNDYVLKRFS